MPRGRPKGRKNKTTILAESIKKGNTIEEVFEGEGFSKEEIEMQKRFKKCVQKALDAHWVGWSEKSETMMKEVATILFKEMENEFNIEVIKRHKGKY